MRISIVFLLACASPTPVPNRPSAIERDLAGTWQLSGTTSATLTCAHGSCRLVGDHLDSTLTYADTVNGTTIFRRGGVEQRCRWQNNDYGGQLDCSNADGTEHLQLWCPDTTCRLNLAIESRSFGGRRT